jgi:hypothetical protein
MNQFTTVFFFQGDPNGVFFDTYWRLLVGVLAIVGGCIWCYRSLKRPPQEHQKPTLPAALFLTIWGIGWLSIHLSGYLSESRAYHKLVDVYNSRQYAIAEGPVQVLHTQPTSGHARGDLIRINETEFEIDYFDVTPGYKTTIRHGGWLTEGIYARVYYYQGTILRVDLKNQTQ